MQARLHPEILNTGHKPIDIQSIILWSTWNSAFYSKLYVKFPKLNIILENMHKMSPPSKEQYFNSDFIHELWLLSFEFSKYVHISNKNAELKATNRTLRLNLIYIEGERELSLSEISVSTILYFEMSTEH